MRSEDDIYQFPHLKWLRGSVMNYPVDHFLNRRRDGRILIPEYQRPLVWTLEQKVRFMESLILGLPIGEYTVHKNADFQLELLDGQQRWNAIFGYCDDEFAVFGLKFSELTQHSSERGILGRTFPCRQMEGLTLDQRIEAYNRLAYGGTPHIIEPLPDFDPWRPT